MNNSSQTAAPSGNTLQLVLATGAFAICFAVFGSVSAMMPILKKNLSLDPVQVSVALAVPVLLGSLGRIPLGMLTDRYGGRLIFSVVMASSIAPALVMGLVADYWHLIVCGFFIGIALASFSVGVGFVSGWYPPERQTEEVFEALAADQFPRTRPRRRAGPRGFIVLEALTVCAFLSYNNFAPE